MRFVIVVLGSILLCGACKKKEEIEPFGNVVLVNGANDTTWLNTVITQKGVENSIYINAKAANKSNINITIWNVRAGRHDYKVDFRSDEANIHGSGIYITDSSAIYWAENGLISVTDYQEQTISGTFEARMSNNTYHGTFYVRRP